MNKNYLYLSAFAIISFFFMVQSSTNVTSMRGDRTGSPLSVGECSNCHNNGGFSPTIEIQLLDNQGNPITEYTPEETYTVNVLLQENSAPGFGFQATALLSDNSQAGELNAVSTNVSEAMLNNVRYVEHASPSGTGIFEMTWTAPPIGSGDVMFYSGGNAVNLDNASSGDNGVTATPVTISEADEEVSCPAPTNLTASQIETDAVEVNWTAGDTEEEWNLIWVESGQDPDAEGTVVNGLSETTYTITDIPYIAIDIYIEAVCNDEVSERAMVTADLAINSVNQTSTMQFSLFPNPASKQIEIRFKENQTKTIEIYAITGARMYSATNIADDQLTIDVHDLNTGIYFLKVHAENRTTVKKFVKQ